MSVLATSSGGLIDSHPPVSLVEQRFHFANCNDQPATRHFLSDDREKSSFRRQLLAVRRKDTAHDELPVDQRNVRAQKPQLADGGDCRARAVSSREYPLVKTLDLVSAPQQTSIGNNDVTVGLPKL